MAEDPLPRDIWAVGAAYEAYVGRWSRLVAREFVRWLGVPPHRRWVDVGCGPGALAETIVELAAPEALLAVDRSRGFVGHARARATDPRVAFQVGDAQELAAPASRFDAVVSGLVLNFVAEPKKMVAEMARVGRPGSTVGLYVWDYTSGMELMRRFWDAATRLDTAAAALDEAVRFAFCTPEPLAALLGAARMTEVETRAIEVPTRFRDFDDFWSPFLAVQGPAPAYATSLSEDRRVALREALRASLPVASDGSIALTARAWAVRGSKAHVTVR